MKGRRSAPASSDRTSVASDSKVRISSGRRTHRDCCECRPSQYFTATASGSGSGVQAPFAYRVLRPCGASSPACGSRHRSLSAVYSDNRCVHPHSLPMAARTMRHALPAARSSTRPSICPFHRCPSRRWFGRERETCEFSRDVRFVCTLHPKILKQKAVIRRPSLTEQKPHSLPLNTHATYFLFSFFGAPCNNDFGGENDHYPHNGPGNMIE